MQATKRAIISKFSKRVFCNNLQAVKHYTETSEMNIPLQYLLGIYFFSSKKLMKKEEKPS